MPLWSKRMLIDRVLIDLATQRDFLSASGAMPVSNRDEVIPRLKRLMSWARARAVPIISAMEAHRPSESFDGLPRHCVDGTSGQNKLRFTNMRKRIVVEADNSFGLPYNIFSHYKQVIFRKRAPDFLSNPKADRLLTELSPRQYVLLGVGLENWIRSLALGLLARHKNVTIVADACGFWDPTYADLAVRQVQAKGVGVISTAELTEEPRCRVLRRPRACASRKRRDHAPAKRPALRRRARAATL